jgi:endonuclease-3
MVMREKSAELQIIVSRLLDSYGEQAPPPTTDPFELVLFENVSYLVDDERRIKAFENLKTKIGLRPADILSATPGQFSSVAALGGSDKKGRVEKLLRAAEIVMNEYKNDLNSVLDRSDREALTVLKKFPSIGEPGAEKILMYGGRTDVLPLDSNGLRVLVRMGFANEHPDYSKTYRAVRAAVSGQIRRETDWLVQSHLLLRKHGQSRCTSKNPGCEECMLLSSCTFGRSRVAGTVFVFSVPLPTKK